MADALAASLFELHENVLTFRGQQLLLFENTLFHLISASPPLTNIVSSETHKFFAGLMQTEKRENLLVFLKTFLQATGWGGVQIINGGDNIYIEVRNPPIGLQISQDRWDFLAAMVEGYLQLADRRLGLEGMSYASKTLRLRYAPEYYIASR